jgi:uncharacterized protein
MSKRTLTILTVLIFTVAVAYSQSKPRLENVWPVADNHQHLFSPPMAEFQKIKTVTAAEVIKQLDEAHIQKAVLLSTAYVYGRLGREPQNEYEKVKEENDWVGAQAALYPKRLIAFCGFNPFKEYALRELERCAKNPNTNRGIKMHFGNSDVRLENPEHIEKLKAVFRAANANQMSIVIHMRASISLDRPYGAEQARSFLQNLMPLATNITVQIAHLGSAGPGYSDPKVDAFMDAIVAEIQDPRSKIQNRKNLYFDLTTVAHPGNPPERAAMVAKRIRQLGADRILYGSDATLGSNQPPRDAWATLRGYDLTDKEIKTIAKNRAPYLH